MPENLLTPGQNTIGLPCQSAVLILGNDCELCTAVQLCWSSKPDAPVLQRVDSTTWQESQVREFDLLVLTSLPAAVRDSALHACEAAGIPAVVVVAPAAVDEVRSLHPQALVIREHQFGCEELVAFAAAALRLGQALSRAERAERLLVELRPLAEVGRFVLDARHKINNTLSSVLGNAELLLLEPEAIGPQAREQVRAIHDMGLRLYELVQRMAAVETDARKANPAIPLTPRRSRTLLRAPASGTPLNRLNPLS